VVKREIIQIQTELIFLPTAWQISLKLRFTHFLRGKINEERLQVLPALLDKMLVRLRLFSQAKIQEGIELALHPLLSEGYFIFLIFHAGSFSCSLSIKWEEQK